jgi:hypothetical protein
MMTIPNGLACIAASIAVAGGAMALGVVHAAEIRQETSVNVNVPRSSLIDGPAYGSTTPKAAWGSSEWTATRNAVMDCVATSNRGYEFCKLINGGMK